MNFLKSFSDEIDKEAERAIHPARYMADRSVSALLPVLGATAAYSVMPKKFGTAPETAAIIGGAFGGTLSGAGLLAREIARNKKKSARKDSSIIRKIVSKLPKKVPLVPKV